MNQSKNKMESFKVNDTEMMFVTFHISINIKKVVFNYRACVGMLFQRMYGHVHMMMNFSATKKFILKAKWAVLN